MKNDGSIYTGQMKKKDNSKFTFFSHGYGIQKFLDGSYYEGEWRNGLCEGTGSLRYENGLTYNG